jgi:hypothetical protein
VELIIICAILGLIPAFIAHSKGRSFGLWWIYGAFLFIIALIHSIFVKPLPGSDTAERIDRVHDSRKCPFCAETIKQEAVVCKHCGRDVPPAPAAAPDPEYHRFPEPNAAPEQRASSWPHEIQR